MRFSYSLPEGCDFIEVVLPQRNRRSTSSNCAGYKQALKVATSPNLLSTAPQVSTSLTCPLFPIYSCRLAIASKVRHASVHLWKSWKGSHSRPAWLQHVAKVATSNAQCQRISKSHSRKQFETTGLISTIGLALRALRIVTCDHASQIISGPGAQR